VHTYRSSTMWLGYNMT